jgi:dephospho-CoA kinase
MLTMTPNPQKETLRTSACWKHGAVPVFGLVGGIGSGKSEVARLLAERGAFVINADEVGHELLKDPAIRAQIVARFGPAVLAQTGSGSRAGPEIDRAALAAIVFDDTAALRALEAILHPRMRARFLSEIERRRDEGCWRLVVLDAAVLLEAGWDQLCDLVVFIDAPRETRIRRVAGQRCWSLEAFEARERAQWSCEQKRRRADLVLPNDNGIDQLRKELDRLEPQLARATPQEVVGRPRRLDTSVASASRSCHDDVRFV